eukprot:1977576-Prymnesium_polylepis.1
MGCTAPLTRCHPPDSCCESAARGVDPTRVSSGWLKAEAPGSIVFDDAPRFGLRSRFRVHRARDTLCGLTEPLGE